MRRCGRAVDAFVKFQSDVAMLIPDFASCREIRWKDVLLLSERGPALLRWHYIRASDETTQGVDEYHTGISYEPFDIVKTKKQHNITKPLACCMVNIVYRTTMRISARVGSGII